MDSIIQSVFALFCSSTIFFVQAGIVNDPLKIGSYDLNLHIGDTLRSEVDFACHGIVLSYPNQVLSPVDISHWNTASFEIFESKIPAHSVTRDFRYSSSCSHFVIFHLREETLDRHWMHRQVDATLLRQEWVRFIFIDDQVALKKLFAHPAIEAIKFKTAVQTDTAATILGKPDRFVHPGRSVFIKNTTPSHTKILILQDTAINVANLRTEPCISKDLNGNINGGYSFTTSKTICTFFNLSYNHIIAYKGISRLSNGTWTGFMGDLTVGDLDVFTTLGHTLQRHGQVDFTSPYYYGSLNFYTAHPTINIKWVALLYPFNPSLWALTGIVSALVIPIFYAQSKLRLESTDKILHGALYEAVWFTFATLLQIGVNIPRRTELLATFFMVFALIVFTAYNSDLMSYLTWPEADAIPRTWSELAQMRHRYNITFHYLPGYVNVEFMRNTRDPDMINIRNSMINDRDSSRCSFDAAGEKNTVCIQFDTFTEVIIKKNLTLHSTFQPLVVSKEGALRVPTSMGLRHHSKYYEFWNDKVATLRATGNTIKWMADSLNNAYMNSIPWMGEQKRKQTKLFRKLTQAFENSNPGLKPFSVYNFTLAALILLGGSICGMLAFLPELFYVKRVKEDISKISSAHSLVSTAHNLVSTAPKNNISSPVFIPLSNSE